MLETVVESWENMARRVTVRSDLTSSRLINFVRRRCWFSRLVSMRMQGWKQRRTLGVLQSASCSSCQPEGLVSFKRHFKRHNALTLVELIHHILDERGKLYGRIFSNLVKAVQISMPPTSPVHDPELDGWKNDSVEAIILANESSAFEPPRYALYATATFLLKGAER